MVGEEIEVDVDLVVLAAGMLPNAADGEAIRLLEDAKVTLVEGDSEAKKQAAAKTVEELGHHEGTEILNLGYRQGPDLPSVITSYSIHYTKLYETNSRFQPNSRHRTATMSQPAFCSTGLHAVSAQ